jgi:phospholipid/cholesterol/gamma-HCH transport system ATP-binding protein
MIEVKNVSKGFNGKQILEDVSHRFDKGKVNLIIGGSGSGKTVLVKCMVGLFEVDRGSIEYDGRNFSTWISVSGNPSAGKSACFFRAVRCSTP